MKVFVLLLIIFIMFFSYNIYATQVVHSPEVYKVGINIPSQVKSLNNFHSTVYKLFELYTQIYKDEFILFFDNNIISYLIKKDLDFIFPDNPGWNKDKKTEKSFMYSDSIINKLQIGINNKSMHLSTIEHPNMIIKFNKFLEDYKKMVKNIIKKEEE